MSRVTSQEWQVKNEKSQLTGQKWVQKWDISRVTCPCQAGYVKSDMLRSDMSRVTLEWLKISKSSQIISALPSWMFLGVCDEILINLNPFGVFITALIAHDIFRAPK